MTNRRLLLLELNELNFDVAAQYVTRLKLKNFERVIAAGISRTVSEERYESLEPWIQWVSAHSGLTAQEHEIFRLGDIVSSGVKQIFEEVEAAGFKVGAISPMNTENRLHKPAYFIPDPWTRTPTDGSWWSRKLSAAISQAVNDNSSGRVTMQSVLVLVLGLLWFGRLRHSGRYMWLALRSKGAPWRKALFLDLFLHDLHFRLYSKYRPDFSTLFLNAGAHIQHHYFFNSKEAGGRSENPSWYVDAQADPIAEMLQIYDAILGDYLALGRVSMVIATGLTQTPYDRVKFYYRLSDHELFLRERGISFQRVLPRMTRDFVVEFDTEDAALKAQGALAALKVADDGLRLFGEIENRGRSLFVTLTYPNEVKKTTTVEGGPAPFSLSTKVVFVAIKNGMHASHGYVCCTGDAAQYAPSEGAHVKGLYATLAKFFSVGRLAHESLPAGSVSK